MLSLRFQPSTCRFRGQASAAGQARPYRLTACAHGGSTGEACTTDSLGSRLLAATAAAVMMAAAGPVDMAQAVAGGQGISGAISNEDFSNQDLTKRNFTKAVMRRTNFANANLTGVSLFGGLAAGANFSGANLTNADLESAMFEGADFTNAILEGAYVNNAQFQGIKSIEGSDWTDVILRKDQQLFLCKIAKGTNPTTGVDTRDSLLCP